MLNFIGLGGRIPYTNSGTNTIASGGIVILNTGGTAGNINAGLAIDTIGPLANGLTTQPFNTGVLQISGIVNLPFTGSSAATAGGIAYTDGTNVTAVASGNTWCGAFTVPVATSAANANFLLNSIPYAG